MRVLIAGGGQVGALIARRLSREGNQVTVVDASEDRCRQLESSLDVRTVAGSAAQVTTLRRAGAAESDLLIAATNIDEINVLACLIAHVESKTLRKVARLRTHEVEEWKQVLAGAGVQLDLVIHPETDIADRIMRVVGIPGVSDILEFADGRVRLFGMNVEPDSWLAGKRLDEVARAGPPRDSLVAMVFRGSQVIIPHGAEVLREGDHIYVVATRDNIHQVLPFMGLRAGDELRRVFILGGKQIGILVAQRLEELGVSVKLFERDAARSERIAAILHKAVVVQADGTDQGVLQEAHVEGADAFLALTNDDEDNIIASLLARRMGVKKVVALINRLDYLPLAQRLGVNATVSPRLAVVDRALQFVRKGRVMSVTTFREEEAEALELEAGEGSRYVGKPLRDLRFPRGTLVGAIVRPDGQVSVPRGDEVIRPGDRVIFFALESLIPRLESAFLATGRARA
ncbi:MAG: Trk system potassium transporter TrkA [Vicinamibacteria bacterium]|nr:Trk system potassium transporter TrkA [Vicinamibacteria bacterium]